MDSEGFNLGRCEIDGSFAKDLYKAKISPRILYNSSADNNHRHPATLLYKLNINKRL